MISFLYRLTSRFEREHGYRPNLIYLNPEHFAALRGDLAEIRGLGELVRFLGMEMIVDPEVRHPRLAWSAGAWPMAVAG
jgi:hypothetical protein